MSLKPHTIEAILGISQNISLSAEEMAKNLQVTFFGDGKTTEDPQLIAFGKKLEQTFAQIGCKVLPYDKALVAPTPKRILKRLVLYFGLYSRVKSSLPSKEAAADFKKTYAKKFFSFVFGKKIRRGVAIVCLGDAKEGKMPIDFTTSFKENPIVTVVKKSANITENSTFKDHMDEALNLFTWHMTNLAVTVDGKSWTVYSFNLSYPNFPLEENFKENVLESLVTKISARVVPPNLNEFEIIKDNFDPQDPKIKEFVDDLIQTGPLFEKTGLYPEGKKVESLKYKNYFYRWIAAIHLDERNGMSYGFMARQLPVAVPKAILLPGPLEASGEGGCDTMEDNELGKKFQNSELCNHKGAMYVRIDMGGKKLAIRVPEVSVLTSRSGSKKTALNPKTDIVKMGLRNGKMYLGLAKGLLLSGDYRPSFDTKVILAHAVANAIFASVMQYFEPEAEFPKVLEENGFAIAHWHGYIKRENIPQGYVFYGQENPSVSCSSPQSAVYAFAGKEKGIDGIINKRQKYLGDIDVEPHHGTNMTSKTLLDIANLLATGVSKLGNQK